MDAIPSIGLEVDFEVLTMEYQGWLILRTEVKYLKENLLVTLWICGVKVRHRQKTSVDLEGDLSFNRY